MKKSVLSDLKDLNGESIEVGDFVIVHREPHKGKTFQYIEGNVYKGEDGEILRPCCLIEGGSDKYYQKVTKIYST
jgi:ATP-dependent DNA ligase